MSMEHEDHGTLYDVIIIGAGPCGLAAAARLRESTPSALFTDDEHQRYHWIKRYTDQANVKNRKSGSSMSSQGPNTATDTLSMLVLDASGDQWMDRWNQLFETYGISHLRSPMFFHIDPSDRDSLLAYSYERGRENELEELHGCVGKEVSKHRKKQRRSRGANRTDTEILIDERDRNDYYTPSQSLFAEHCARVAMRYRLNEGMICQEEVIDIDFGWNSKASNKEQVFSVTSNKELRYARSVILAIGAANSPHIPGMEHLDSVRGACHSMCIDRLPPASVVEKIQRGKETNILIVGGGLTSAQIADQALSRGVGKVWLLLRGPVKVKHFDIDLKWAGKYRNVEKAAFWSADSDEERWSYIKDARKGGSMSPKFYKIIKHWISQNRLSLHPRTILARQEYDSRSETWSVVTHPHIPNMPFIDHVYWATGVETRFTEIPCLSTMNQKFPISGCGGLPSLNNDLMWQDGVPLYVTGKLASLRLGPSAPNLEGARLGAERIAWSMNDRMNAAGSIFDDLRDCYKLGVGTRYDALCEE